jgi:hypothetical protein
MRAHGGAGRSTDELLSMVLGKTSEKEEKWSSAYGKYTGFIASEPSMKDLQSQERDLIKLYLYNEAKGFKKAGEDVIKIPLERYQKLYPEAETYFMESMRRHGEPIEADELGSMKKYLSTNEPFSLQGGVGDHDAGRNILGVLDDVGGFMAQFVKKGKENILVAQDLWKFNPADFSNKWVKNLDTFGGLEGSRWSKGMDPDIYSKFEKLSLEKQSGMLDKIGKPFYLVQNNPIEKGMLGKPAKGTEGFFNYDIGAMGEAVFSAPPASMEEKAYSYSTQSKFYQDILKKANDWQTQWYASDETLKRVESLMNTAYKRVKPGDFSAITNFKDDWSSVYDAIGDMKYISKFPDYAQYRGMNERNVRGTYSPLQGPLVRHDSGSIMSTAVHEGAHAVTSGNRFIPEGYQRSLKSLMFKQGEVYKGTASEQTPWLLNELRQKAAHTPFKDPRKLLRYYRDPTEVYARMMQMRQEAGVKPGQKINEGEFRGMMYRGKAGFTTIDPTFYNLIKKPKSFMNLMNKLPAIGGVGAGIGAMTLGGGEANARDLTSYSDVLSQLPTYINASTQATLAEIEAKRKAEVATNALVFATEGEAASAEKTGGVFTTLFEGLMGGGIPKLGDIGKGAESALPGMFSGVFSTMLSTFLGPLGGILGGVFGKLFSGAAKMATGGIVPPGYPNDSFPALLTSGEVVVPKDLTIRGGREFKSERKPTAGGGQPNGLVPENYQWQNFADTFQIMTLGGGTAFKAIWNLFHKKEKDLDWAPKFGIGDAIKRYYKDKKASKFSKGGIIPPGFPNDTYPAWLTSGEMVFPSTYIDLDIERLTGKGSLPTGDINDEFQLLLSTYEKVLPDQTNKEKTASRIYNYNNVTEHLTKVPRLKSIAKDGAILSKYLSKLSKEPRSADKSLKNLRSIPKMPKEVGISDKYLKRLSSMNKVNKESMTKIPKVRALKETMPVTKIPKVRTPKDFALKVPGIKVTKDKTLNYLSKMSRTKAVDEKSINNLLKLTKTSSIKRTNVKELNRAAKSTEDNFIMYKNLVKVISDKEEENQLVKYMTKLTGMSSIVNNKEDKSSEYLNNMLRMRDSKVFNAKLLKNTFKETRYNERSIEKLSKTLSSSRYLNNIAKMSRGGIIPKGYPRDSYLARLSSGERVIPPQKLDHLEPAGTNIHITLDGAIKNRDLALMIRRIKQMN